MPLYSAILLGSVIIPFVFSFDKKVCFFQYWRTLFPSIIITGSFFIAADVFFVTRGVWGFNPAFHSGILILRLPIEEWLFFILIPYACVFTHYVFINYFPDARLGRRAVNIVSSLIIISLIMLIILNLKRSYTIFICIVQALSIIAVTILNKNLLSSFYISFLVILFPFFLVNSLLTGSFISEPVFWYDESEILGFRILTVPVEDAGFAFSLILLNLLLMSVLKRTDSPEKKSLTWK